MSEDDDNSNLEIILKTRSLGYQVRVFKLMSSDFGLPSRRVRLYFAGFSSLHQPNASLDLVETLLGVLQLKSQPPDS